MKHLRLSSFAFSLLTASALHAIPTEGLTAYWDFDSSDLENSSLASGNVAPADSTNLDLVSGSATSPAIDSNAGIRGGAVRFDASQGQFLQLTGGGEVISDDPLSSYTISVWFRADSAPAGSDRFFIYETSPSFTLSLGLREDTGNTGNTRVQFFTQTDSEDSFLQLSIPDGEIANQWVHTVVTWDASTKEFTARVNGSLPASETLSDFGDDAATFNDFHIGTFRDANGRFFPGLIDELAIWNRVLTSVEMDSLTLTVVDTLVDENNGNNATTSLREAIASAPNDSTIVFDTSDNFIQLRGSELGGLGELVIDKSLTIDASNVSGGIIIDGDGNGDFVQDAGETRCIRVSNGEAFNRLSVTLNHLTLQNGSVEDDDGGILLNDSEDLVLNECRILNGRTIGNGCDGGGIYSFNGNLTLNRCTIAGNVTEGNNADGGGLFFQNGNLTLDSCTVAHNSTSGNFSDGGGIYSSINSSNQKAQLLFCTFAHNQAPNAGGGGFYNERGPTEFMHCTITQNLANTGEGSGFANANGDDITSNRFENTLVVGNHGSDVDYVGSNTFSAKINSSGGNIIGIGNAMDQFNSPTDRRGETEAFLSPLGDYGGPTQTMHPLSGLTIVGAIDGGRTTDQRGFDHLPVPPNAGAVSTGAVLLIVTKEDSADPINGSVANLSLRQGLSLTGTRVIRFASGLNGQTIILDPALGELLIADDFFIDASSLPLGLTINADDESRCIKVSDGSSATDICVALQNINLTGGASSSEGGGLFNDGEFVTLNDCRVFGNQSADGADNAFPFGFDGGGIYSLGGSLALNFSEVSDNFTGVGGVGSSAGAGGDGGGIAVCGGGMLTLNASLVRDNRTGRGGNGGAFSRGFEGRGGGIYSLLGTVTLTNSTVSGNATDLSSENTLVLRPRGGGIYAQESALNLSLIHI